MESLLRAWIVEILSQHKSLLAIAIRQRAKFEGWLKFELAAAAEKHGASSVEVESVTDDSDSTQGRSDVSFSLNGVRCDVELKTPNSNWRMPGVDDKHRPITKNIKGIITDAQKLRRSPGSGIVAFVLFPVPPQDDRWVDYLQRISAALEIPLNTEKHCQRLSIPLRNYATADLIVCAFPADRPTI